MQIVHFNDELQTIEHETKGDRWKDL